MCGCVCSAYCNASSADNNIIYPADMLYIIVGGIGGVVLILLLIIVIVFCGIRLYWNRIAKGECLTNYVGIV